MRALKFTALAMVATIAVAVVLIAIGLPASMLTSAIESRVAADTGYRLKVNGATRIGVWPSLHLTLQDLTLQEPTDSDTGRRVSVASVQADIPLQSLVSGAPQVSELTITRPLVRVPLLRERARSTPPAPAATPARQAATAFPVERITVTDGAVVLFNARDGIEDRIDGVDARIGIAADRRMDASGSANLGGQAAKFSIKATLPAALERQTIPLQLALDAPGVLSQKLNVSADVRINGTVLMINGVSGTLGDDRFNGWASADLTSKPLVKLDLDFQKLDIPWSGQPASTAGFQQSRPWSSATFDLRCLNYADAQLRISAAQLGVGAAHFAPVSVDATLSSGVLKARFAQLGVYGGTADGDIAIDATQAIPVSSLRVDLNGVRALPLLSGLADFDSLDGRMQAKISVRTAGNSQLASISGLTGSAFISLDDGAIRGINLAQMIRSLTSGTLAGWQDGKTETTDLSHLAASFRIDKGQASTSDLALAGPLVRMTGAGTVDLGAKALGFRVEPRLVMTLQGQGAQGAAADPVGLGVPVIVQGPWAAPRFYPDVAGILDNPDAAYAKLREMGKGLFGGSGSDGTLGGALGNLIQQGLGAAAGARGQTPAPAPAPDAPARPADDASQTMNAIMKQLFGR